MSKGHLNYENAVSHSQWQFVDTFSDKLRAKHKMIITQVDQLKLYSVFETWSQFTLRLSWSINRSVSKLSCSKCIFMFLVFLCYFIVVVVVVIFIARNFRIGFFLLCATPKIKSILTHKWCLADGWFCQLYTFYGIYVRPDTCLYLAFYHTVEAIFA